MKMFNFWLSRAVRDFAMSVSPPEGYNRSPQDWDRFIQHRPDFSWWLLEKKDEGFHLPEGSMMVSRYDRPVAFPEARRSWWLALESNKLVINWDNPEYCGRHHVWMNPSVSYLLRDASQFNSPSELALALGICPRRLYIPRWIIPIGMLDRKTIVFGFPEEMPFFGKFFKNNERQFSEIPQI